MRLTTYRFTVAGALSVLTAASVGLLGWNWLTGTTTTVVGDDATMGGLTVNVAGAEWTPMDHAIDDQGYQMPDQMMPGGPTGDNVRLGVSVTLTNTQSVVQEFSLVDDFTMVGGLEPEPRPLTADTVGNVERLGPGAALDGTLYFDVAVTEDDEEPPPLYLRWSRGRDAVQIPVPLPGEVPEHQH